MWGEIILTAAALFPAIVLGVFIYMKDKAEKEPKRLLALLLASGVIIILPVIIGEIVIGAIVQFFFKILSMLLGGNHILYHLYHFVSAFIGVALVEEGFKWMAMWLITSKNKNFNSLFDGIVYAVFVSLGFAAAENIMYVFNNGIGNAFSRMITAVPAHTFFGILMGCYYSRWHIAELARKKEKELVEQGLIEQPKKHFSGETVLCMSLIVPVAVHGFYDYVLFVQEWWTTLVFLAFLVFLYVYCFKQVNKMSKSDTSDMKVADVLLLQKYPELIQYFVMQTEKESIGEREELEKEE